MPIAFGSALDYAAACLSVNQGNAVTQLNKLLPGAGKLLRTLRRKHNHVDASLLESQCAVLKGIAAGATLRDSLEHICRTVEKAEPDALCTVLQLQDGRYVHSIAATSLPLEYTQAIEGREIGDAEGSCGTAMWRREQVIVNDIANSPLWFKYREFALRAGLRACWSTPIFISTGEVLGSFAVYYHQPRMPSKRVLALIATAVNLASVAMERDRMDRELIISRTHYELAQRLTHTALWQQDFKTGRRYWSPEFRRMLDLSDDMEPGTASYSRVLREDLPRLVNVHLAAEHDRRPYEIDYRVRWRNGEIRHLIERGQCSYAADGTLLALTGVIQDETERRDVTAKLAALSYTVQQAAARHSLDDLLQVLAENARNVSDAHIACIAIHDETTRRYRIACSTSEHHHLTDAQGAQIIERLRTSLKAGHPLRYMRGQSDAGVMQLGMWCMEMHAHEGASPGYFCVLDKQSGDFTDLDDRLLRQLVDIAAISIENVLLYSRLEARVAERTSELQQSYRELEAFSYSVSHDLRGPLRTIAGFVSAIGEDGAATLTPVMIEYLQRISESTERMSKLIDNLLNLSRVSRVSMKFMPVDLSALAAECGRYVAERYPGRSVQFNIQPDLHVTADPGLLAIVLDNLLDNAWKFTRDRAGAQITLTREFQQHETVYVLSDNGAGFDPDQAERLFGAFQRLHSDEEFPGTGIGLASVQRIVLRHGGRIWASGVKGEGAKVFFTLPDHGPETEDSLAAAQVMIDRVRTAP